MALHVIVGSGPVGTAVAELLSQDGQQVRIVTRRGTGPEHPAVERIAADATDAARMRSLTTGAVALYNCANPAYTRWPADWPPLAASLLGAAGSSGAVLAVTGNLYGYGPVAGPITEQCPLAATTRKGRVRARMWQDALAAHDAGRVRAVEARGADYLGTGSASLFSTVLLPAMAGNRTARLPADLDAPHSFTYPGDMARALVVMARDERAWGRAWHVPSPPPITIRDLVRRYCDLIGHPGAKLSAVPRPMLRLLAPFVPMLRELAEMDYQFYAPMVLDSSAATRTFGLHATALDTVLAEIAACAPTPARP
jgi:nucleoside-diphosphate-sugar epimerase